MIKQTRSVDKAAECCMCSAAVTVYILYCLYYIVDFNLNVNLGISFYIFPLINIIYVFHGQNVEESKVDPSVNGNSRNVDTLSTSKHKDVPEEHYHDLVEITEMDYSPAKRKPPIHN